MFNSSLNIAWCFYLILKLTTDLRSQKKNAKQNIINFRFFKKNYAIHVYRKFNLIFVF